MRRGEAVPAAGAGEGRRATTKPELAEAAEAHQTTTTKVTHRRAQPKGFRELSRFDCLQRRHVVCDVWR